MKIIDERVTQKNQKQKKKKTVKNKGETEAIVKGWELNNFDFFVHLS